MSLIDSKKRNHFRERNRSCNICGITGFHISMKKNEERRRELMNVDFNRAHRNCDHIQCSNCDSDFPSINSWNRHLNQCNYDSVSKRDVSNQLDCDLEIQSSLQNPKLFLPSSQLEKHNW